MRTRRNLTAREIPQKGNVRTVGVVYSFSDTRSDSFFGDSLFSKETNSRPEAGMPTLPSLTMSLAPMSRPLASLPVQCTYATDKRERTPPAGLPHCVGGGERGTLCGRNGWRALVKEARR